MAFLSHEVPWVALRKIFQFDRAGSAPGPQDADIYFSGIPGTERVIDYFVQRLQSTIVAHAAKERKKWPSAEAFRQRASSWKKSILTCDDDDNDNDGKGHGQDARSVDATSADPDALRIRRNQELRSMQNEAVGSWHTHNEERVVFSSEMAAKYDEYMKSPVNMRWQHIESWISYLKEKPPEPGSDCDIPLKRYHDARLSAGDIFKLLMIEAAGVTPTSAEKLPTASSKSTRTQDGPNHRDSIEALFLLTHHPQIGLRPFLGGYQGCCNISCGPENLGEETLSVFVYLNLIVTLGDGGVTGLTELVGDEEDVSMEDCERMYPSRPNGGLYGLNESYSWLLKRAVQLKPRPTYMDTRSWKSLMIHTARWHELLAESVAAQMIVFPRRKRQPQQQQQDNERHGESTDRSISTSNDEHETPHETDPLADPTATKQMLQSLWRILITVELLMAEVMQQQRQKQLSVQTDSENPENEMIYDQEWRSDQLARPVRWDRLAYEFFMSHFKKREWQQQKKQKHANRKRGQERERTKSVQEDEEEVDSRQKGAEAWKSRILGPWPDYDYQSSRESVCWPNAIGEAEAGL